MSGGAELQCVANPRVRCTTTVPSINLPLVDRVRTPAGMFSGLRGRALRLSSKNSSSLLSISNHVSHRSSHQLLRLKHAGRKCTPISTKPSPSYFSRIFSDASGRGLPIGNCKSVLKQQQPRLISSNGSALAAPGGTAAPCAFAARSGELALALLHPRHRGRRRRRRRHASH